MPPNMVAAILRARCFSASTSVASARADQYSFDQWTKSVDRGGSSASLGGWGQRRSGSNCEGAGAASWSFRPRISRHWAPKEGVAMGLGPSGLTSSCRGKILGMQGGEAMASVGSVRRLGMDLVRQIRGLRWRDLQIDPVHRDEGGRRFRHRSSLSRAHDRDSGSLRHGRGRWRSVPREGAGRVERDGRGGCRAAQPLDPVGAFRGAMMGCYFSLGTRGFLTGSAGRDRLIP